ncbi:hypothetical protein [Amycolatopsis sp. NPDC004079]|uniref:hypothetical protein n=1 Tax=Amycolatopsis sp. NPDC004079 TaxID=3154549 RepID=UPI0033ABDC93
MAFDKSKSRGFRAAASYEEELAGATIPAPVEDYADRLAGYFARGGTPTPFHDFRFGGDWELAIGEAIEDGHRELGAKPRNIIVGKYGAVALNPSSCFGGWGHTRVYFLSDCSTPQAPAFVPVYADPEFESVLTEEHRRQRARAEDQREQRRARIARQAGRRRLPSPGGQRASEASSPAATSEDDRILAMLAGCSFGPLAQLKLPSGTMLGSTEAGLWTGLYGEDAQ